MKYEWRKSEKEIYLPKNQATIIEIPEFKYFTIIGQGDPNSEMFSEAVNSLYGMAYGIKMAPKKGIIPKGYFDYTVYPLEGFWTLNKNGAKQLEEDGTFNKKDLIFKIMIRQPDFVTKEFALETIERISITKPNLYNTKIQFECLNEGLCVQILHIGSYDNENESFQKMNEYCKDQKLERLTLEHKEIYISDPRKSAPEKNKTVLRYAVKKINSN